MDGETVATSLPLREIDNAEKAKSPERLPETNEVSEKNNFELPNLEVREDSEVKFLTTPFWIIISKSIYFDFNSQVQAERKVEEDKASPHNSVSEAFVAPEVQQNEPSVST